jgi:hypothetical protein
VYSPLLITFLCFSEVINYYDNKYKLNVLENCDKFFHKLLWTLLGCYYEYFGNFIDNLNEKYGEKTCCDNGAQVGNVQLEDMMFM